MSVSLFFWVNLYTNQGRYDNNYDYHCNWWDFADAVDYDQRNYEESKEYGDD